MELQPTHGGSASSQGPPREDGERLDDEHDCDHLGTDISAAEQIAVIPARVDDLATVIDGDADPARGLAQVTALEVEGGALIGLAPISVRCDAEAVPARRLARAPPSPEQRRRRAGALARGRSSDGATGSGA